MNNIIVADKLQVGLTWAWEHYRDSMLLEAWTDFNLVPDAGLNHILGVVFHADSQITSWRLGLFSTDYTPAAALVGSDVGSAFTEFTGYSEYGVGGRPVVVFAAPAAKSITNSANKAVFTITSPATIYGGFLISSSTGATGTIVSAVNPSTDKIVAAGDELRLALTVNATST